MNVHVMLEDPSDTISQNLKTCEHMVSEATQQSPNPLSPNNIMHDFTAIVREQIFAPLAVQTLQ